MWYISNKLKKMWYGSKKPMIQTIIFSATSWCEHDSYCGRDSMIASLFLKEFARLKAFQFVIDKEYVPGNWSPSFEREYMICAGQLPQPGRMSNLELELCEDLNILKLGLLRGDLFMYQPRQKIY